MELPGCELAWSVDDGPGMVGSETVNVETGPASRMMSLGPFDRPFAGGNPLTVEGSSLPDNWFGESCDLTTPPLVLLLGRADAGESSSCSTGRLGAVGAAWSSQLAHTATRETNATEHTEFRTVVMS